MSPRKDVTRDRIEALLRAIGDSFRHPCRLYLSGGDGLVWRGLRGLTRDVDISFDLDPAHHDAWIRTIRDLKDRLDINIEEAQPGHFVPLPPGSAERAEFIGRFGQVDAFLFDPYAVALSKLERGHVQDCDDVRALLAAHVIERAELRRLFEVVLQEHVRRSLKADPDRFRATLDDVLGPPADGE